MGDGFRRRTYIGGLSGGLAALAGCGGLRDQGDGDETASAAASESDQPAEDDSSPARVRRAAPGEVQAVVDAVADEGGGIVRLEAGERYAEGSAIHVRPDVVLDGNGAVLAVEGGEDGCFLDTGSAVVDARFDLGPAGEDARGVVLDSSRSEHGKYSIGGERDTSASFHGVVLGDSEDVSSTGIELVSDGGAFDSVHDSGITMGCRFAGAVAHCETGVRAVASAGGWINSVRFDLDLSSNVVGFLHEGSGDGMVLSDLRGAIQTPWQEGATGVRNVTDQPSVTVYGRIWDADPEREQRAIEGPGITVVSDLAATHTEAARDAAGSYGLAPGRDGFRFVEYGDGGELVLRPSDAGAVLESGDARLLLGEQGQVRPQPGGSFLQLLGENLAEREGEEWWELAIDDGSNTDSGAPALGIWHAGEWHLIEPSSTVSP